MNKKILYVKNSSSKVNLNTYNVQAVGLGKAFCKLGYDYDFLYFSNKNELIDEQNINGCKLKIISKKGIRIFRSYYCPSILNENFLSQYDMIISTEYGQIMTYFLSKKSKNTIMYSGPYYNLFKLPFVSFFYDLLFTKSINNNIKHKFVKSVLAKQYLEEKGYTNIKSIGVALDTERFNDNVEIEPETQKIIDFMKSNRCILYVGTLSDRKNFPFLLEVYKKVQHDNSNIKFVIIGKGNEKYVNKYMNGLSNEAKSGIYRIERIDNSQLRYIYPLAKAFLLPSKLEIFGMVLLESMYLGAPVVTSWNGGSSTLIDKKETGIIIDEFDADKWKEAVQKYLDDEEYTKSITQNARKLIESEFNWITIARKMLESLD